MPVTVMDGAAPRVRRGRFNLARVIILVVALAVTLLGVRTLERYTAGSHTVEGTVVRLTHDLTGSCTAFIDYSVDGTRYETRQYSCHPKGSAVAVHINPHDLGAARPSVTNTVAVTILMALVDILGLLILASYVVPLLRRRGTRSAA